MMRQTPDSLHTGLTLLLADMSHIEIAEALWKAVNQPTRLVWSLLELSNIGVLIAIDENDVLDRLFYDSAEGEEEFAGTAEDMRLALRVIENMDRNAGDMPREAALAVIDILRQKGLIKRTALVLCTPSDRRGMGDRE
jgi:hypothetical protein